MLPQSNVILALIHTALGDLQGAKDYAEVALKLSLEFNAKAYEGGAWMALGSIVGKADPAQIDFAEGHIRHGISIAEDLKARASSAQGYLFLGELFAPADQRDAAMESLKKAEAMYQEMKVTPRSYWLTRIQAALTRLKS
jgi:tetratricopeptide (TPR) repeat protein